MVRARLSEREGKFDDRLQCRIQHLSYDFCTRAGRLDFPSDNCCDMSGAIELFTTIDPNVRVIETFAGGKPDTLYRRAEKEWIAFFRDW